MPLQRYGVLIGTLSRFARDNPNDFGNYYHGKIYVDTPDGEYECAVDFTSPLGIDVHYRVISGLSVELFAPVSLLLNGYHNLAKTPSSGALDYARSPLIGPWIDNPENHGLDVLERCVRDSKRLFVFGEPWRHGRRRGMHNIHCNQGDPPGPHRRDNGIWQDGGTIIQRHDGDLVAFLTKFASQSLTTDDRGWPI
jgi:hypothetical protein